MKQELLHEETELEQMQLQDSEGGNRVELDASIEPIFATAD